MIKYDVTQETMMSGDDSLPSFSIIRRVAVNKRIDDTLKLSGPSPASSELWKNLEILQADSNLWEQLAREEENLRKQAKLARDEAQLRAWQYQNKLRILEQKLALAGLGNTEPTEWPTSFDDLENWANEHLAGRVVIVSKAIKSARRSVFLDCPLAYKALYHLSTTYWEMRVNGGTDIQKIL